MTGLIQRPVQGALTRTERRSLGGRCGLLSVFTSAQAVVGWHLWPWTLVVTIPLAAWAVTLLVDVIRAPSAPWIEEGTDE